MRAAWKILADIRPFCGGWEKEHGESMILSVSRRTDIPNYYGEWFANRIREGFLYVRNPMNAHQISRIDLSADVVDGIVFWTKNPAGIMNRLEDFKDYAYYFQFTLTGYGKDVEPNLPEKRGKLISIFQDLSERIGKEKVIWRYDPILLSPKYTVEYHLKAFEEIAGKLAGYTEKAVISFVDQYMKIQRNMKALSVSDMTGEEMTFLAGEMAEIASRYHLTVETCAEQMDFQDVGIRHGSCIDKELLEKLSGCRLEGKKDKNQRKECGCLESMEVGAYNTCPTGCKYCYANVGDDKVRESRKQYQPDSPLLCGKPDAGDIITDRKVKSLKTNQVGIEWDFQKNIDMR